MNKILRWLVVTPAYLGWLFTCGGNGVPNNRQVEDSATNVKRILNERSTALDFFRVTTTVSDISTMSVFSEINYVRPRSWQKKPYVFNGVFNTPIPIGGKWFHIPRHGIYFAVQFHPDFVVRVMQDDTAKGDVSLPVRTPSFKPGFTVFVTCNRLWNTGGNKPKHYFAFKIGHHSNGQDGAPIMPDGYWNRYNGDFSDFIIYEFIYGGFWGNKVKEKDEKEVTRFGSGRTTVAYNLYWKGAFSLHPPSGMTPEMAKYHLYGYYRSSAQVGFIWAPYYQEYVLNRKAKSKTAVGTPLRKEIFRVYATIDYIWDTQLNTGSIYNLQRVKIYDITKRMNASITFSARIAGTPFAGVFAQTGYYASDPYNVYFQQSVLFFRVGLSVGYFISEVNADKKSKVGIGW